jgi:hypothetical protein
MRRQAFVNFPRLGCMLGLSVMAGVPAHFVVQPVALWRWPGRWRLAADRPRVLFQPLRPLSRLELVAAHADFRSCSRHAISWRAISGAMVALRLSAVIAEDRIQPASGLRSKEPRF